VINRVYRLVEPKKFQVCFLDQELGSDRVYVRPTYLSICAADQRYYLGLRPKEVLDKKLPMSLIHEAIGEVVFDAKGEFKKGDRVVMIPNTPTSKSDVIKESYIPKTKFRSSGYDGFMQTAVPMRRDRVIKLGETVPNEAASFIEMFSIPFSILDEFDKIAHSIRDTFGVWGDGNIGFVTALVIKKKYPNAKVYVMGKDREKMSYFSFADGTYDVDELPKDFKVDHAFECCGGKFSESAINQIIDYIGPQGVIGLLGVSEEPPRINTRMVLEKGLTLIGSSRSGYMDFKRAAEMLQDTEISNYLSTIVSEIIEVEKIEDINKAFDSDATNKFKTVLKWNI